MKRIIPFQQVADAVSRLCGDAAVKLPSDVLESLRQNGARETNPLAKSFFEQYLENADIALGPTADGGYYLVGVKEPSPFLFENQTYGRGSVFENTAAAARAAGKTVAPAPPCDDVDTPEDLRKLNSLSPDSYTARYLSTLHVIPSEV